MEVIETNNSSYTLVTVRGGYQRTRGRGVSLGLGEGVRVVEEGVCASESGKKSRKAL